MRRPAGLVIEAVFWLLLPALFLFDYLFAFGRPAAAALTHFYVIGLAAALVLMAKVTAYRFVSWRWPLDLAFGAIYATLLFTAACYYALVHVILGVWGKVITIELLRSYGAQARTLCEEVLGIRFELAAGGLLAAWLLLFVLFTWRQRRADWRPALPAHRLALPLMAAFALLAGHRLYDYLITSNNTEEPISLTLLSGQLGRSERSVSQGLQVAPALAEAERKAIADYQPAAPGPRPNLILIVIDGLRADHMGIYGYARDTTPNLSALLNAGTMTVASQVHASCSETTCGLGSLASSRYSHLLPDQPFTLQKVMKRHGYRLQMILGDNHHQHYSPEQLYGPIDDYFDGLMAKGYYLDDDTFVLAHAKDMPVWDKRPLMLQLHLMAAHTLGKKQKQYIRYLPAERYAGNNSGAPGQAFTNYYDAGVLQADAEIGELLDSLKARHYLDNALVVITADHGEGLGEHNIFSHTNSVYEPVLHIPLAIIDYRDGNASKGAQYKGFASQVDIAPTVLDMLAFPAPSTWVGQPLRLGPPHGLTFFQMVPYAGLFDHRDPAHRWKFWQNARTGEEFAFNLLADPGELHNLVLKIPPAQKAEWRKQLQAMDPGRFNGPAAVQP